MSTDRRALCASCGYSWPVGQDGQHSCVMVLRAEVERLRDRVRVDEGRLGAFHQELVAAGYPSAEPIKVRELREQRDALAEALAKEVTARRWRPLSEWESAPLGRLCEIGEEQGGIVYSREITARSEIMARSEAGGRLCHRGTHFRECLRGEPEQALAALRKAGRLP